MASNIQSARLSVETTVKSMDQDQLNDECQQWALAHGFFQRTFTDTDSKLISYPFTLYPSPFPRHEYEKACQLQFVINFLVHRIANNRDLLEEGCQKLLVCDPFVRRLHEIYNHIQTLPFRSVAEACIIRTDYMLQEMGADIERTKLRLIEINTIAIGLGAAAKLMHTWHKQFLTRMKPELLPLLPENESHDLVIDLLHQSWKIYNNSSAIVLFIVPEREFNIGDQQLIEQGLLSLGSPQLIVKYATLIDIHQSSSLDEQGTLRLNDLEIAVVYYRHAYDPEHFHSEYIWQTYTMLESSRAIKCPSLRYHLAGMKCFQVAIADERFLQRVCQGHTQYMDDLRAITEDMFTIDQAINDPNIQRRISTRPDSLYLKQSREGGGHVYCGPMLKERLEQIIAENQSDRYFLMARVFAPIHSTTIRSVKGADNGLLLPDSQVNGELGIFGGLISQEGTVIYERTGGSLLRSKLATNIEGGIASGLGCIDSVLLI